MVLVVCDLVYVLCIHFFFDCVQNNLIFIFYGGALSAFSLIVSRILLQYGVRAEHNNNPT